MIFYFLNPQIEYIYQYNKSIRIDNQIFSTLSNPTDIAEDSTGNIYVLDAENDKIQKLLLTVHLLKNGISQEQKCQNNPYFYSSYKHCNFKIVILE
jgi:hypothetical protein